MKLNGRVVWESALNHSAVPNRRGVNVIVVNASTCSAKHEPERFDTDRAIRFDLALREFLDVIVDNGDIVVGVTADAVTGYLVTSRDALGRLAGHDFVLLRTGSFAFVAQKGFPAKTARRVFRGEVEGLQPVVVASVTGTPTSRISK